MSDVKCVVNFKWDFENAIDDFVFICFFAGNDFVPRLPSMHIRDGALDILIILWKDTLPYIDGFLTKNGVLNFKYLDV
jgi:5'-3' exoribonuclease 2